MTRQEWKIAAAGLLIIALTAGAVLFGQPRLGNPGLVIEPKGLTNEVGQMVVNERVFFPPVVDDFIGADSLVSKDELAVLPADTTYGRKLYRDRSGLPILMSAVVMKRDRTSIHKPQNCVLGQGWKIEKTEIIDIPVAKPHPYKLKATALQITKRIRDDKGNEFDASGWYIFWFVDEENVVAHLAEAHMLIARNLLLNGKLHRWGYVSCYAYGPPGQEGLLLARMKRLISSATPEFQLTAPGSQQTASNPAAPRLN